LFYKCDVAEKVSIP